jgi:thioredoxin-like negative regulator of GroEL
MAELRDFPRNGNLRTIGPALLYVNVAWCGHCRAARPILEAVSGVLGSVVPVYSIDGDERGDLAKALRVQGFPTIVYVDEAGARYRYEGERTVDAITSFVCHNSASRHQFCTRIR